MATARTAAFSLLLAIACAATPQTPPAADAPHATIAPAEEGVLYAIGVTAGAQLEPYRLSDAELQEVVKGLLDSALGRPEASILTEDFPEQVESFRDRRLRDLASIEREAGQATLDAAAAEPGAVVHESGLIATILEEGVGESPGIFDFVVIRFHGTLRDGTVFYSNRDGEPLRVQLGTTTRCWQEAFALVAPGGRLRVVCPPELGYRHGGWPERVPGGAVLRYELELVERTPGVDPSQ